MALLDTIKRDFKRHRAKAGVLGVLFAVMIVMSIRAVFQLQPQTVAANVGGPGAPGAPVMGIPTFAQGTNGAPNSAGVSDAPLVGAEAEERINKSKELWHRLREVRGIDVAVAFSFDASFYPPDPTRRVATITPEVGQPLPVQPPGDFAEQQRRAQEAAIREQVRHLSVKSTTVTTTGKPWAIVNQQLLSVGDHINGFEITAIRSREVEFTKEGVTERVKMPDDFRGQ